MTHEQQRNERVEALSKKWCQIGVPDGSEFAGLTPNEARQVAVKAGYDADHVLHEAVREGCAESAKNNAFTKD